MRLLSTVGLDSISVVVRSCFRLMISRARSLWGCDRELGRRCERSADKERSSHLLWRVPWI